MVLTAVSDKMRVSWDVVPYSLLGRCRNFWEPPAFIFSIQEWTRGMIILCYKKRVGTGLGLWEEQWQPLVLQRRVGRHPRHWGIYIELHAITSVTITEINIFLNKMNSYNDKRILNISLAVKPGDSMLVKPKTTIGHYPEYIRQK